MKRKDLDDVDRALSSISLSTSPRKSRKLEFKPPTGSPSPSPKNSRQNLYNKKRKGIDDFSSSSLRKSRRLTADFLSITNEDNCSANSRVCDIFVAPEQGSRGADMLQPVAVPPSNSSEEGAIVLYNPRSQLSSINSTSSSFRMVVDPELIQKLKDNTFGFRGWESVKLTKEEEADMEGSSESSNNCGDIVPWVPPQTFTSPETQKEVISEAEAKIAMVYSSASNCLDCGRVFLQSGRTITGGVGLEPWHSHDDLPPFSQSCTK